MYYPILIIVLIAAGLWFTIRTKAVQIKLFPEACRVIAEKPIDGGMSSLRALMISTASRVGTGNIVGVSTAICLGGFGAVFWMWIIAIIGMGSAFVESTLAQIYKLSCFAMRPHALLLRKSLESIHYKKEVPDYYEQK